MATRRDARQWAMQILFELDVNPRDISESFADFWKERGADDDAVSFSEEVVRGVMEHRDEIDALIQKHAENWDVNRMSRVDRNVMRIALYEMLYRTDIPPVVSIDEAVDISKLFGTDISGRFVNGILDKISGTLDRPSREVAGSHDQDRND